VKVRRSGAIDLMWVPVTLHHLRVDFSLTARLEQLVICPDVDRGSNFRGLLGTHILVDWDEDGGL